MMTYTDSLELEHYGVKGMKWGIRRYQNYDGSYTQKGLARVKTHLDEYESAKKKRDASRKSGNRLQQTEAKGEMRIAKRKAQKAYKSLKSDKLADQGKALYKSGKTITDNSARHQKIGTAIVIGTPVLQRILSSNIKDQRVANISTATIAIGASSINALMYHKNRYEAKRLRAYYAHGR